MKTGKNVLKITKQPCRKSCARRTDKLGFTGRAGLPSTCSFGWAATELALEDVMVSPSTYDCGWL